MVDYGISGQEVKPMDGSIHKSALNDQQAAVTKQSNIINMTKSGGATDIPVPANQPAYPEQATGNQSSQSISNQLNSIKANSAANSEFDSQVKQNGGKRSKRSKRTKRTKRSKRSKRTKRRSRKYYRK
jgi:hypothetical protein